MSVLVSDQDRGGDALVRIAPSKTVKLSEYSKSSAEGVWRIADSSRDGFRHHPLSKSRRAVPLTRIGAGLAQTD